MDSAFEIEYEKEYFLKEITPELIEKWEKTLMNKCSTYTKLVAMDKELEDFDLNYEYSKTIQNDVDRTRTKEVMEIPEFRPKLRQLLIIFCKFNNIDYKQGLNEILAPLLLLKEKIDISLQRVFNLFSLFIDKFLTNYYLESDIYAFKSSVGLLTLLLKYHEPELYSIFEKSMVSPQMYGTNWLLTSYANKLTLYNVYKFWDLLIEEDDQLFLHYMIIAFLQRFKKDFFTDDFSMIPMGFSCVVFLIMAKSELSISLPSIIKVPPKIL